MKRMILTTALAAGLLVAGTAYAHEKGEHTVKTYDLTDFSVIDISGVYRVELTVGDEYSLSVEGHDEELAKSEIEVKNGTLYLGHEKDRWKRGKEMNSDKALLATITMPEFDAISVQGVTDFKATGIDADRFEISVSGVADMDLSGTCNKIEASVNGVGDVDARDLKCKDGEATVNGVGSLSLYTSESVEASVNGLGEINVYGEPKDVEKNKGWFSKVTIH